MTVSAFAQATADLAGPDLATSRLAVAVSGGADSLALMALAAEAFPGRVQVLSFDHMLRAESADECALVSRLAGSIDLSHQILRPSQPLPHANVQARARDARYGAMAEWCGRENVRYLLTAHHADDQAETLLLRLARGSGSGGLSGIRSRRAVGPDTMLLRPLLGWRRQALRDIVLAKGWQPVVDPSNQNMRFDRTRARALLAATDWLDAGRISAVAAHLADADAALEWAAAHAWASRATTGDGRILLDPEALPAELQRRLLLRGLQQMGTGDPDGAAVARLATRLAAGGGGTLGTVEARALSSGRWLLKPAQPRSKAASIR